jgi:hypothetical protein
VAVRGVLTKSGVTDRLTVEAIWSTEVEASW